MKCKKCFHLVAGGADNVQIMTTFPDISSGEIAAISYTHSMITQGDILHAQGTVSNFLPDSIASTDQHAMQQSVRMKESKFLSGRHHCFLGM